MPALIGDNMHQKVAHAARLWQAYPGNILFYIACLVGLPSLEFFSANFGSMGGPWSLCLPHVASAWPCRAWLAKIRIPHLWAAGSENYDTCALEMVGLHVEATLPQR